MVFAGHDLHASTRPSLDFSDDGHGAFLRLTPVPRQEHRTGRTCTYIDDTAASPAMKCGCASRAAALTTRTEQGGPATTKDGAVRKFLLPSTPLRLVPVVRGAVGEMEGEGHVGKEVEMEKEEGPSLKGEAVTAP
jgi:hypothetical protein